MYHSYAGIPDPWDRLRWCRYGLDLLQKEVAAMVGMEEWLYRDLESGAFHRSFTPELADKLAALYGIPVQKQGGKRLESPAACRPRKGQPDKHPLLGKRAKDHQSEVL